MSFMYELFERMSAFINSPVSYSMENRVAFSASFSPLSPHELGAWVLNPLLISCVTERQENESKRPLGPTEGGSGGKTASLLCSDMETLHYTDIK